MEISGSKVLNRFLFKRCIPILAGEQNLLSKTNLHILCDKLAAFLCYTH